jgi:spore coat polysaccharide biosynthesis predicted glycosyltransferase SpsG
MNLKIFSECGSSSGFGHISRCSALVEILCLECCEITWYIRLDYEGDKVPAVIGNVVVKDWDKLEFSDLSEPKDFCVFDSYAVNLDHYIGGTFDKRNIFIVSITDATLNFYSNGVILLPSLYAEEIIKHIDSQKIMSGEEFFLTQSVIRDNLIIKNRRRKDYHKMKIGISLGATATSEISQKIIQAINKKSEKIEIYLYSLLEYCPSKVNYLGILHKAEYVRSIANMDLLITACGQSLNEAVILGLPVVPIAINEGQIRSRNYWLDRLNLPIACSYEDTDLEKRVQLSVDQNSEKILPLSDRIFLTGGSKRVVSRLIEFYKNYNF